MIKRFLLGIFILLNLVARSQTSIDYLTGIANVNFPIYSLQGRTMEFPVTLNYNTSSPKVNDIASWVGLGWTLNAGGAVTREVHGLPDEVRSITGNGYTFCEMCGGYLKANDLLVENGFWGEYIEGSTPPYSGSNTPQDVIHTPGETDILTENIKSLISSGKLDLEPDFFQVNAPGLSLKFMFSVDDDKYAAPENGFFYKKKIVNGITQDLDSVITFPKQDIIVEYTRTENEITSFIITNLDGTVYKFEQKQYVQGAFRREDDIERDGISYVMAWMLTSVTNANGQEEAHFTYTENDEFSSHRYLEESKVAYVDGQFTYVDTEPGSSTPVRQGIGFCEVCEPFTRTLIISKMKLVRIQSIVTPLGSIVFSKALQQRQDLPYDYALNDIQLLNADDEFMGRCELKYSYFVTFLNFQGFEDFEYPEDSKRLKLSAFTFYDSANIPIDEGTHFNYNESGLPVRNSYAQDHWGYFNYQNNKSLACEYNFDQPYNRCGPNRESGYNVEFAEGTGKPCLLSQIDYPDGGFQYFEYEPNTFSKVENQNLPLTYNVSDELIANVNHMLSATCYEDYTFETASVNFSISWNQDTYIEFFSNESGNADISCTEPPNDSFLNRWITIVNSGGMTVYNRLLSCSNDEYNDRELVHLPSGNYSMKISGHCTGLYNHNTLLNVYLHYYNTPIEGSELETRIGGGQRIKRITTTDGDTDQSNNMVIRVEYPNFLDAELSSGTLITKPKYAATHHDEVLRSTGLGYLTSGGGVNITLNSENNYDCLYHFVGAGSIEPLQTENGSFIVYNYIKVFNDFDGQASGFTDYFYDLDDIPEHSGLVSGINFSRTWRNNALRRSNTYNSSGELLATVIYDYEETEVEVIYGVQAGVVGESGIQLAIATGVDHNALRQIQRSAIIDMCKAALNFATSWGRGLGMTMAAVNFAMSAFSWIQARVIAINNEENSYTALNDATLSQYQTTIYSNITEAFELKSVSFKEYDPTDPSEFLAKTQDYDQYHHHALPSEFAQVNVNVPAPYNKVITKIKYSDQYDLPNGSLQSSEPMIRALALMKERNMKSVPVETLYYVLTEEGLRQVVGGQIRMFRVVGDLIVVESIYSLETNEMPYSDQNFTESFVLGVNNFFFEKPYRKVVDYTRYDMLGNPLTVLPVHGIPMTTICSYPSGKPIASIYNASAEDCAYTSFEKHAAGGFVYDEVSTQEVNSDWLGFMLPDAKTGHRYLSLTSNSVGRNFDSGEYVLSFWKKLGSINITSSEGVSIENLISEEPDERGWEYVEYKVSYQGSGYQSLSITTTEGECLIDELRFYPVDALMSSVCYNFDGTIQCSCDENSFCSYTGYNAAGNPIWTMDEHYNVRATLTKVLPDEGHSALQEHPKYVSRIMLDAETTFDHSMNGNLNAWDLITTQFFYDGLGRITQTHGLKQSPGGKDVIANNIFDMYGRSTRQYLPFVRNFEGQDYIDDFVGEQLNFYQNQPNIKHTDFPFSDIVYDDTPRNRIIEGGAVGEDWQIGNGHTVRQETTFNDPNEVIFFRVKSDIDVNSVVANFQNRIVSAMDVSNQIKYWPEDKLKKVKAIDENGKEVWQFFDPFGRLILKRMMVYGFEVDGLINTGDFTNGMGSETGAPLDRGDYFVDTYFVYDNYGSLRFEIPHSLLRALIETGNVTFGEGEGMINYDLYYNLGYGYKYDHRGNLFLKHSPEVPDFYVVYDEQNRPVMTQDAKQRQSSAWSFIRYDQLSRPCYKGILNTGNNRQFIQSWYYDDPIWFGGNDDNENYFFAETRSNASGSVLGYTHWNAPYFLNTFNETNILKVYYYDDYEFDMGSLSYSGAVTLGSRIRGVLTGELTKVLGTPDQFLVDCTFYDAELRPVELCSSNLLDGYDRYSNLFDWRGVLLKTTHEHLAETSNAPLTIVEEFNRDRMGRLLNHYQTTGSDRKVMLAGYEYNELGQVRRKHIHIPLGMNTGMQTIDYSYNERGWLRTINNSGLVDDGVNLEDYDVFGLQLNYTESDWNEEVNRYGGSPLVPLAMYNGNLASIIWNAKAPETPGIKSPEKTYVYRYDDMYRLTCGAYAEEDAGIQNYGLFVNEINSFLEKSNYDVNGNINKILRIHGAADGMNGSFLMDKLELKYAPNSYRLISAKDGGYLNASENFVHFTGIPTETVQYEYDILGNCVTDHNKKLEMEYNEIGLVSTFTHFDNPGDPVIFTYDADGTLLKKEVGADEIYYIHGTEYEMEDGALVLRQMHTAEGIVRPRDETENNNTEFVYDYFLTDHLGNVRVIITEGNSTEEVALATMELDQLVAEESEFQYLPYSRDAISIGYPANAETGEFVAALDIEVDHGPSHLSKVLTGDQLVVSVQSWFPDAEESEAPVSLTAVVTSLAVNLASQGIGILDEGLITLTTDETWQTSLVALLQGMPETFDPTYPQGYLVYMYFDASLTPDPAYSGMLQVTSPDEIEELQTQLLTMPGEGFFYTYLTNFSDNLVTFDNLTIRHKQGTLRNIHEYYPYGLEYWRSGTKLYDRGDQFSEFHHREWELDGIEMNRFAARWYDPVIARWHAPDPLEQMHSPYVALCGDPANFVDPDGRAGIHLSDWDNKTLLGFAGVIAGGAAMVGIGQALQGASGISQAFQAIRGVLSAVSTISSGVSLMKSISSMSSKFGVGSEVTASWQNDLMGEIRSHSGVGMAFRGAGDGGQFSPPQIGDPKANLSYKWYTVAFDEAGKRQFYVHQFVFNTEPVQAPQNPENSIFGFYIIDNVDDIPVGSCPRLSPGYAYGRSTIPTGLLLLTKYARIDPIEDVCLGEGISSWPDGMRNIDGVYYDNDGYPVELAPTMGYPPLPTFAGGQNLLKLGKNINQLNQMINRGQLPSTIRRFDGAKDINSSVAHVHFWDGYALRSDGVWRHKNGKPFGRELFKAEKEFLQSIGWTLPN